MKLVFLILFFGALATIEVKEFWDIAENSFRKNISCVPEKKISLERFRGCFLDDALLTGSGSSCIIAVFVLF